MPIVNNDKHSIGDLFNNRNPFMIPKHQRAYSWEKDEVEAFCTDIKEISKEYFFGGVVSVHQLVSNSQGRTYKVVDGQQRLATFTLFIALLKNAFNEIALKAVKISDTTNEETAKSLAADLEDNYLTYKDTKKRPPVKENRLTMSKVDLNFFKDLLKGVEPVAEAASHKKLLYAWKEINTQLINPILKNKAYTISEQLDMLQDYRDKVLEQSVVIHIVCDNLDEAFQLFEVLNDRGKALAVGDYLRSTTLEYLEKNPTDQVRVSEHWDYILSKNSSEKFIRSYLSSHIGVIKKSHLHRQFQQAFFDYTYKNVSNDQDILNRVSDLRRVYDVYELIENGEWPYKNSRLSSSWEKNRLKLLINQLEHKLCIPFLLAAYDTVNEQDFKKIVFATEKFVFRYISVANLRANVLSQIYQKYILSMRKNNTLNISTYMSDLQEIIETSCNDEIFGMAIYSNLIYKESSSNRKKLRYFFTTVEDYYGWFKDSKGKIVPQPATNIIHNVDNIEIEHIYPQNPKQVDPHIDPIKNSIGNLTFWAPFDNKYAGNGNFTEKVPYYKDSNIAITRKLGDLNSWGFEEIEERKKFYRDISLKVFQLSVH